MSIIFKGAATALVTPFSSGKVDYPALKELIEIQISQGIDAIVSCGTTGEASTLEDDEHIEVVKFTVKEANGRVPVLGGAGSNDTKHALMMARELVDAGVNGLLMVTPYYNKCSEAGLINHFTYLADKTEAPIILYSVPSRTGVNITPKAVSELCHHPNIKGIKEASGNISQVVEIARYVSDDFALYSGNDDMIVPLLSVGGVGAISTVANIIPADVHNMIESYLSGNVQQARWLQLRMKPLIDAIFSDVNPIPVKAALNMLNLIEREYRMPLCEPSNKVLYDILSAMQDYGLLNPDM